MLSSRLQTGPLLIDNITDPPGGRASPVVAQHALAWAATQLRSAAGLSQDKVAAALGCRAAKVSMIENGRRRLSHDDVVVLLDLFQIAEIHHDAWHALQRLAGDKGWWDSYGDDRMVTGLTRLIGMEQGSLGLRTYQPGVVHELLQTAQYAEAILRQRSPVISGRLVRRRIELLARRQYALDYAGHPLGVWLLVDETTLKRVIRDREVTSGQLDHLARMAGKPNVTVQVVPANQGAGAAAHGAFTILDLPWGLDPAVCMERLTEARFLRPVEQIDVYSTAFDALRRWALPSPESLALIERHRDAHSQGTS